MFKRDLSFAMFVVGLVYLVFLVFIPLISNGTIDLLESTRDFAAWLNETKAGVFHIPSIIFIGLAFVFAQILRALPDSKIGLRQLKKEITTTQDTLLELTGALEKESEKDSTYEKIVSLREHDTMASRLIRMIYNGCSEGDIRLKLSLEIAESSKHLMERIRHNGVMSGTMPLLGMIGTITGLMFIFSDSSAAGVEVENVFSNKFAGMGTALLTTLYATLFTAMYFKPRQHNLTQKFKEIQRDIETVGHIAILFMHRLDLNEMHHATLFEPSPINDPNIRKDSASNKESVDFDLSKYAPPKSTT